MGISPTFLHVTDVHVSLVGTPNYRDDRKTELAGLPRQTRELALEQLLGRLAEQLEAAHTSLDGIIFSGDAQERGRPGGHRILLDLLLHHFGPLGIGPQKIVAVPGNHDVDRNFPPSTAGRYKEFCEVWRDGGCVVPWLDGVEDASLGGHSLVADDASWAIFPINSSNWCHSMAELHEPLATLWSKLPELGSVDPKVQAKLSSQLDALARYDVARVSEVQLDQLRKLVGATPKPEQGRQLRIGVLHHQLRSPSLREELKPFAEISNLELIRAFLRDREFDVVIHGHKHEHAAQFEHLYDSAGEHERRVLVISGATFDHTRESDAVRLLTFAGLPYIPSVTIKPFAVPRAGVDMPGAPATTRRLWTSDVVCDGPTVIQGDNIDQVYERVVEVAKNEAANRILVVHLDLPAASGADLPLPSGYPLVQGMDLSARQQWLEELVDWWQLDRSKLEARMPFVHGSRLRRYGGKIDQIKRIKKVLAAKPSTRALAILIDPFRDFTEDGTNEQFASFTVVEFKRRDLGAKRGAIDVVGFYRTQEFGRWWPINIAELRKLQIEVAEALNLATGRITTITADARTSSRSPTQAAMPIIDRWLDQKPERLFILANALASGDGDSPQSQAVVDGWQRCLGELREVAENYNPDGVPLPIEGLETLASYLRTYLDVEPTLKPFVTALEGLAQENRTYEDSDHSREGFNTWVARVQELIATLQNTTQQRVGLNG
jgi:3',5'-cyclic AMP phosphodiesterase CpdA